MKNTNQNSGSKSVFKPVIATSLALALGVSVASADALAAITENATVNADIDAGTAITTGGKGGLIITPEAATTVTLGKNNINIATFAGDNSANAYGVYINGSAATTVTADTFSTLTVVAPTGGKANYIFANTGTGAVTFKNAAIVVGTGASTSGFGIYNNTANSAFAFGAATNLVGADGTEETPNAAAYTGVILSDATTLGGTLNVTGGNGYTPSTNARASFNNVDGGAGADTTGIRLGANLTVDDAGLNLTVTGGNGGAGANGGSNGVGGAATGIVATDASTVSGGDITINLVAGNNGGSEEANPKASLTAIKNGTTTLAFDNGVNVGVGTAAVATTALTSSLAGVGYEFGTGAGNTTFTLKPAQASDGKGTDVIGAKILKDATFSGNVIFDVAGGQGKAAAGGSATGLNVNTGKLTHSSGGSLKITAVGGNNDTTGALGTATGILLDGTGNFDANSDITLLVGNDGSTTSVATGVDIQAGKFASSGTLTFGNGTTNGVIAATTATGINLAAGKEFDGASIVFNKVAASTATGIISAGTFASGNINLGTIAGTTSATGIAASGSFTAGEITFGSLGANATTSATVLDLNGANLSMTSLTAVAANIAKSDSTTTNVTLIKNAGTSAIKKGTIKLDAALKGVAATTNIISNTGTLNFGTAEGSNASLILGGDATTGADVYGFSNKIANTSINFGTANFYTTGKDGSAEAGSQFNAQSTIGANLENVTNISGTVSFTTSATDSVYATNHDASFGGAKLATATGMKVIATALAADASATSQILGDVTLNVTGSKQANAIGMDITTASNDKILAFGKGKTIDLNVDTAVDSTGTATGIVISGGSLSLKQNSAAADAPASFTDVGLAVIDDLNVGTVNAQKAVALSLTSGGTLSGAINLSSGVIGNETYTQKAVAIEVNGGTIGASDIFVGNILKSEAKGNRKYILDVVNTTNALAFNNKSITANAAAVSGAGTYGLYSGLSNVGYNFGTATTGGAEGVTFAVAGAAGKDVAGQGAGANATGVIIADNTFFEGKTSFTVTGGNADSTQGGNGGSVVGIDVKTEKALTFAGNQPTNSLKLEIDAGTGENGAVNGVNGDAVGIQVASDGTFDASGADTLTLKVGATNAVNATAISLNNSTFAGSFTADKTNVIGNKNTTTSATLIKNIGTGESNITSGVITLIDDKATPNQGLVAKADGTTAIISNAGTLNFGVLANPDKKTLASNASLTIANAASDFAGETYGFANNVDGTAINFGIANFNTTGAADTDAAGMIVLDNTTLQGTIAFNTLGGSSSTSAGGDAYGIYADATGGKTLTVKSGSITLNVDGGVGSTGNGTATGLFVKGGALSLAGNGGLDLQVGTNNASKAIGFHFATGGSLNKGTINLLNSSDKIGNENAMKATAVFIAHDSGVTTDTFALNIEDQVLSANQNNGTKYVLEVESLNSSKEVVRTTAVEFDRSSSQYIKAGTPSADAGVYGIYSGIENVSYNFGYTKGSDATIAKATAGTIFSVTNDSGDATGAILAANTAFEGKVLFKVDASATNGTAVGIRLDGNANFDTGTNGFIYQADTRTPANTINAGTGTAIALKATGTHIISGNITIESDILTGGKGKEYIFQNTNTSIDAGTTFNGSLTVGDTAGSAYTSLGTLGFYNNFDGANYAFGGLTTFNVIGAADGNATGAYIYNNNTTGVNFSGNVVFNVAGGDYDSSTTGSGTGLYSNSATKLILAPNSTMTLNVDSGVGQNNAINGMAKGISVTTSTLTINTLAADGSQVTNGTRGFVFNVGAENASIARAIELTAGGAIAGDLYIKAGSVIGNASSTEASAVVVDSASKVTGQKIIVEASENPILVANEENGTKYIFKNTNDGTGGAGIVNEFTGTNYIQAGAVAEGTPVYGIYHAIANAGYDFGKTNTSDAGTTFTVTGESGKPASTGVAAVIDGASAVGAIITANTHFAGKATFEVDGGAKLAASEGVNGDATGINVQNAVLTSNGADITLNVGRTNAVNATALNLQKAEFATGANGFVLQGTVGNTANTTNAVAIATSEATTISGKGISINTLTLNAKAGTPTAAGTKYYLQNTGTLTFNNAALAIGDTIQSDAALYGNVSGATLDFGSDLASTTFKFKPAESSSAVSDVYAIKADAATTLKGDVTFEVTGGDTTGSSIAGGNAFGIDLTSGNITLKDASVTLRIDAGKGLNGGDNGSATGVIVGGGNNFDSSKYTLEIGTVNAKTVTGVNISGKAGTINVGSGVFGNKDYTTDIAVIRMQGTDGGQDITVGDVELNATADTRKYILKNSTNALTFNNGDIITVGKEAGTVISEKYSFYSAAKDASYDFGNISNNSFAVEAKEANDAVGMILAADTRIEGQATFGVSAESGNAAGIKAIGKTILTLGNNGSDSVLVFNISSKSGEAKGINASEGTLEIVKEGNSSITFNVGNANQTTSSGISLDDGVFSGDVKFDTVQAQNAYGIKNTSKNVSIIKSGIISFAKTAFDDANDWAVIQNDGNLTIARGANIYAAADAGTPVAAADILFDDGDGKKTSKAGIYNNIKSATYNLGSLSLDVAKNTAGKAYGIYSADAGTSFNVAAGNTLEISAENPASVKAFGGSVNLNLASEAGKQTNVYINTDGGYIANLTADDNSYIYLSGADKASRVGYASTLSFRTLEIGQISSAAPASRAVSAVQKGANFVVLADANRKNGTAYDADGNLVGGNPAQGSAYNVDGSASTTGGSDRIVINYDIVNMPSVAKTDNKLGVALSSLGNASQEKYVVLAQVANGYTNVAGENGTNKRLHELVTFNGLTKDGDTTEVQTQVGFDTAKITIQRHDLAAAEQTGAYAGMGAVYVSNLIANDVKIDANISDASVSAISTNFDLMSANLNSLSKRMGELRNTDNAQGVWGRVFAGQQTSNFGIEQTSTYLTFQAGYDYNISLDSGVNYSGLALSYVHGSSKQATTDFLLNASGDKVAGNATASTDGVEVALYNSYISDMGLYSDSIVKFGYFTSDLNIPAQTDTYNTTNFSVAVSEEIGYRVKLGAQDEWFIDPQAELAYAFINGSDFTQKIGTSSLKTSQDAASLLRARVGAAWGYKFDHLGKDKGIKASLYLGTYYAYDVISGGDVNLETNNGTTATQSLESNGRFVLNVGTDVSVQDNTKFYVDFEKSFGSTMQTDYQVSVGVRYSFGAKDASVKKDEKKEAPLKVSDKNAENN